MNTPVLPGASATLTIEVTDAQTVPALPLPGVADFPRVFATAYLVGLAEMTAVAALHPHLREGEGSVGIDVRFDHTAATPVGMQVTATATVTAVDGRVVSFEVELSDEAGPIGRGTHQRAVIDLDRFNARAAAKAAQHRG